MHSIHKSFLLLVLLLVIGCTTQKPANAPVLPITTVTGGTTKVSGACVKQSSGLTNVDWSKYSEYSLFTLYLILLITACVYFKYTGKRSTELETSLKTMSPRFSPVTTILSYLAKVIGLIYCKKK